MGAGRQASGVLDGIGSVWEWTSSDFAGYPGFEAFPYPEYSEVFFGAEYKVLRGASWATHPVRLPPDVPQLGLPDPAPDLLRHPLREGCVTDGASSALLQVDVYLTPEDRARSAPRRRACRA